MTTILKISAAALLACLMLASCQGRRTADVQPDGSDPEEVTIPDVGSPSEAREILRSRVKNVAPARSTPREPVNRQATSGEPTDSATGVLDAFGINNKL